MSGHTGKRIIRWRPAIGVGLAITAIAVFIPAVLAVHDTGSFEMDGNAVSANAPAPAALTDDWDRVCHQVSAADCPTASNTTGATAVAWIAELNLNASIFTGGGSKDPQNVNQWAWKDGAGGLPDKDNLLHSFAVRYSRTPSASCPAGTAATCELLFFGSDRYDNSGDAQQGFWFFQKPVSTKWDSDHDGVLESTDANCPITIGGGTGFCDPKTGLAATHQTGDLLIISDFSNGGSTSTISVYKWNPAVSGNLQLLETSDAANCASAADHDQFCGIVNATNGTPAPWPFTDKSGLHTYLQGEFYEGGVNLSLLGLASECFATVASETRSSTSTTATLKDFVLGTFGNCDTHVTTTPQDSTGTAIPGTGISITTAGSIQVQDSADLTVVGIATWSGKLNFYLCSPTDLTNNNQTTCATGGTHVPPFDIAVNQSSSKPQASGLATITSTGRYCWRGVFTSGTGEVPDASDSRDSECFTVNPVTPTLTTTASATIPIGGEVYDTAHLSGTAKKPNGSSAGGTITFKLYSDNQCSVLATGFPTDGITVNVTGDGDYVSNVSTHFAPSAAGTYVWVATYSGDSPNTAGPVGSSPSCDLTNETVTVTPKQPSITTIATYPPSGNGAPVGTAINDTATLSGTSTKPNGQPAGGTITFSLYGPSASAICTTPIATSVINVSGDGNYSASAGTITGSLSPTGAGTYYWIAVYSGDSPNTSGVSHACGASDEASLVVKLQTGISTAQTYTLKDTATITSPSGAGNLAGTIQFRLFNNSNCDAGLNDVNVVYDSNKYPLNNPAHPNGISVAGASPQVVNSDTITITTTQSTLSWLVEYKSSNAGQTDVTSSCNKEHSSVTIVNE